MCRNEALITYARIFQLDLAFIPEMNYYALKYRSTVISTRRRQGLFFFIFLKQSYSFDMTPSGRTAGLKFHHALLPACG